MISASMTHGRASFYEILELQLTEDQISVVCDSHKVLAYIQNYKLSCLQKKDHAKTFEYHCSISPNYMCSGRTVDILIVIYICV